MGSKMTRVPAQQDLLTQFREILGLGSKLSQRLLEAV